MSNVVNAAAYKFAPLANPAVWRDTLRRAASELSLKGTILLSREGINLFLAGDASRIELLLDRVREIPGFEDLQAKLSVSDRQPFTRLLVRVKQEIIAFGQPGIEPFRETVPTVAPAELKQWLDQKRPLTLLDVRNNYEVELGTFVGARPANIDHFRDFPRAVAQLPSTLRRQPVVMFCTGGIRCEKAGPFLQQHGFDQVYQLEGGILKYFQEIGGAHYDGACFVFDKRVAVGPDLQEVGFALCYVCQAAVTPDEQTSPQYVPGVSCPRCYVEPTVRTDRLLRQRVGQLAIVTSPLPGSIPYENRRPLNVAGRFAGLPLIEYLVAALPAVPRETWLAEIAAGRLVDQGVPLREFDRVRDGQRLVHLQPATIEPAVATDVRFIYEDDALIVVDKPAPLPMHPCGRFHRNTLTHFLDQVYAPLFPRPQHRLDANTTGVVVLAKTKRHANVLRRQFEARLVSKLYVALLESAPPADRFEIDLPISSDPGENGRRTICADGKPGYTAARVLRRLAGGQVVVAIRPTTGRTNQIRVHLAALGCPIVGDHFYQSAPDAGLPQTSDVGAPPLCLCHYQLQLIHPNTGQSMQFTANPPPWLTDMELTELAHD